jgi:hypothetical protein
MLQPEIELRFSKSGLQPDNKLFYESDQSHHFRDDLPAELVVYRPVLFLIPSGGRQSRRRPLSPCSISNILVFDERLLEAAF